LTYNKFLAQFKQGTKVVIATTIMGIAIVSTSGISNANYNNSTSSVDKYIQVLGSAYVTQNGVTTSSSVSIRTGAATAYSVQGTFKNGTNVCIIGKTNNFYKVSYSGITGYIDAQFVKIIAKPVVAQAQVPVVVYKAQVGISTGEGISIRTGPGIQYSWQDGFHLGEKINILGTSGSFYKVSYSGKTGYVSNQYVIIVPLVEPTPPTISKTLYGITTASVSIRTGAHINYSVQGIFNNGTNINIIGIAGSFYKVSYNGKTGFIDMQYVKIIDKPVMESITTPTVIYKAQYCVTTSDNVCIRTGAASAYSVQGTFNNGTNVTILGTAGTYYKVSYSGKTGFIEIQYVKLTAKPVTVSTAITIYKTQYGVATGDGISIRTGAATQYSWQGSFALGTSINILGTAGTFYKVSYSGKTGYVSNQYVTIVAAPFVVSSTPTVIYKNQIGITTNGLSIRTGAGTNYSVQDVLNNGTNVNILGTAGSFYKISYSGKTGYVSSQYVNIVNANTLSTSKVSITISNYNYTLDTLTNIQFGLNEALTDVTGNWLLADKTQIRYYADPLNVQGAEQKYQFLKLNYCDGISASDINSVVQGKGILSQEGSSILNACKTNNVNPAYLIAHFLLETGNGSSTLSNGVLVTSINGVPVTPRIVYNLFGIGALDSDPVRLGSEYAYSNGWFSVDQAIAGGSNWISEYYINNLYNQQDTLYKMRWNPYTTGIHQYSTDIGWASKQTTSIKAIMDKFTTANLYFDIPHYTLN